MAPSNEADQIVAENRYKDQRNLELHYWKSAAQLNESYLADRNNNPKAYHGNVWLSAACALVASNTEELMEPYEVANYADEILAEFLDRFDCKTNMLKKENNT